MAIQVKEAAKGNASATGMPRSEAPDEISRVRSPSGSGHGMNGDPNGSSVAPGKRVVSPLGLNLEQSSDDDGVLNAIMQKGSAAMSTTPTGDGVTAADGVVGSQLRDISAKNVPDHSAMASNRTRQPSYLGPRETIPSTLGATAEQPVRKPGVPATKHSRR
jgi:hypothetical protein